MIGTLKSFDIICIVYVSMQLVCTLHYITVTCMSWNAYHSLKSIFPSISYCTGCGDFPTETSSAVTGGKTKKPLELICSFIIHYDLLVSFLHSFMHLHVPVKLTSCLKLQLTSPNWTHLGHWTIMLLQMGPQVVDCGELFVTVLALKMWHVHFTYLQVLFQSLINKR